MRNLLKSLFAGGLTVAMMVGFMLPSFAAQEGSVKEPLKFNDDGKFTIMQVTDVQDTGNISKDTILLLEKALEEVKPDLVVFTGDQVEGYSQYFKFGNSKEKTEKTIDNMLKPLVDRNVNFALVFGNHDHESGTSLEEQMAMYAKYPNCYAVDEGEALPGTGTYNIPIMSSDNSRTAFNIFMVNSHDYDLDKGGYDYVKQSQIDWCSNTANELKEKNNGAIVPSFVFQHIAVQELYSVLKEVPNGTDGAIKWYRDVFDKSFVLDESNTVGSKTDGFTFNEPICSSDTNSGQFDAWLKSGDVIGAFFGHDHINNFVGNYKGIALGYSPGIGLNAYSGGLNAGVRVFEIDQNSPKDFGTFTLTYRELVGEKPVDKIGMFTSEKFGIPKTEIAFFASYVLIAILAVVAIVIVIVMTVKKKRKKI